MALTDKNNFRKDIHTKSTNRNAKHKPLVLKAMRQHIMDKHNGVMWKNLEAMSWVLWQQNLPKKTE